MAEALPFWAREQLKLRQTFEEWIGFEIDRYEAEGYATDHACNVLSAAGTSSAYAMPALFLPTLGGLAIHFGRAPWVNALYYTDGQLGLPPDVAALYVPPTADTAAHVKLASAVTTPVTIGVRKIDPLDTGLSPAVPDALTAVTVAAHGVTDVALSCVPQGRPMLAHGVRP